jgi:hypothetical protein
MGAWRLWQLQEGIEWVGSFSLSAAVIGLILFHFGYLVSVACNSSVLKCLRLQSV